MREMFPFNKFGFIGVLDEYSSSKNYEGQLLGTEDRGEPEIISYQHNTAHQEQQAPPFLGYGGFDDLCFDLDSSSLQLCQEQHTKLLNIQSEISELIAPMTDKSSSASLGLQKNSGNRSGQWNNGKSNFPSSTAGDQTMSTTEIIRSAGEMFIPSSSVRVDDLSDLSHPFSTSLVGLSDEKRRDVEVIQYLLASAEKVGEKQFDRASKLLNQCDEYASPKGNPIQRLVYYFSKALRERINLETGGIISKGSEKTMSFNTGEALRCPNTTILSFNNQVPLSQVIQFTGMQAIIENVTDAKKIHLIDLEIRIGAHCSILIQALASRHECPVEYLKVTAIGTQSKTTIEETGMRLKTFAESMNLSFSFSVVMVKDMLDDLNESLFELNSDEAIAVYSPFFLYTMIPRQDRLECLMRVVRSMNPRVMVVAEIEANLNSPVFVNRFIEAFFYFGAFFDFMVDCMRQDEQTRNVLESLYFGPGIRNIVATEKEERTIRHVKINIWRRFFAQFNVIPKELSMSALYQATLVKKSFTCESSCSLDMNGQTLIIGWKGTPLVSLSAWAFI